jgi:hypothetical protein
VAGVVSISSPARFLMLDATGSVERISAPKLFIASEDDIPAARSQEEFWEIAPEPKEMHLLPGDAHGTDLFLGSDAAAVEQMILDFLRSPD